MVVHKGIQWGRGVGSDGQWAVRGEHGSCLVRVQGRDTATERLKRHARSTKCQSVCRARKSRGTEKPQNRFREFAYPQQQ